MNEEHDFTVRDLLNIIYRRIWILKVVVILFPLSVLIACLLMTPSYETAGKIVVTAKKDTTSLLTGTPGTGPSQIVNLNVEEMDLNTEMEILRSLDLWAETVKALAPELLREASPGLFPRLNQEIGSLFGEASPAPGSTPSAAGDQNDRIRNVAKSLLANFNAIPTPKSKVIDVSLRYPDPIMVQKILTTLLDKYIPYHLKVYSLPQAELFFAEQVKETKENYDRASQELTEFRKRWNLSLPERQKQELISMMKSVDDALLDASSNLSQYGKMMDIMKSGGMASGQLSPSMQRGGENTVINVMAVQLLQAEQKQLQVGEIFTAESRDYRAASDQARDLANKFKDVLAGELAILQTKKTTLENNKKSMLEEMRLLLAKTEDARVLQLHETIAKEQYLQMVNRAQAARMDNVENRQKLVDVKILARPFVPTVPVFPKTGLFFLAALIFSVPLALGIIFTAHFFDYTFDSPGALEKSTGFRVLATLGKLKRGRPFKQGEE